MLFFLHFKMRFAYGHALKKFHFVHIHSSSICIITEETQLYSIFRRLKVFLMHLTAAHLMSLPPQQISEIIINLHDFDDFCETCESAFSPTSLFTLIFFLSCSNVRNFFIQKHYVHALWLCCGSTATTKI